MLERLNSLWVGDRLGYLEQLCLVSALSVGHPFTLYSYTPKALRGTPQGVELRDAREIMSEDRFVRYSVTPIGSDFFRYALLARNLGYWVDMDLHFLKPFDFRETYVFGWERENSINNAVLNIPAQSDMLHDLCALPETNWCPPFFGPRRTLLYYWARLKKGNVKVQELPWGTTGPGFVTYLAKKYRFDQFAQEPSVFYPVPYDDAEALFGPADVIEGMIKPETRAIHMWRSRLGKLVDKPPSRESYLDIVCRRYGIETDCTALN